MGVMDDTGVPAGLTFMGKSGSDRLLLACASEYEAATKRRIPPRRTPSISPTKRIPFDRDTARIGRGLPAKLHVRIQSGRLEYSVDTELPENKLACRIFINGVLIVQWGADDDWKGSISIHQLFDARKIAVVALYTGSQGRVGADVAVLDAPPLSGLGNLLMQ